MTSRNVNQFLYWLIEIRPLHYGNSLTRKWLKKELNNKPDVGFR
jgi:hypothetical protein